jgi:uncharacterized protein (DUF302 family)
MHRGSVFLRTAVALGLVLALAGTAYYLVKIARDKKGPDMTANSTSEPTLVTLPSAHSAADTVQRFESALKGKGIRLFAKIDHAEAAREAGLELRPTTVLIFGSPKVGTALMQSKQTIGLDLPLKVLVWEDEAGKVWLTYAPPEELAQRHQIRGQEQTIQALSGGLEALARAAIAP